MIPQLERRWVLIFALVTMAVTTLPYLLGFQAQTADWQFSGFVFGVDDGNSYIAKMLRGSSGDWLFRTPYTAYPQSGFLAFLPYYMLGKLVAAPGLHDQLVALFQLFRWAAGFAMIWATYAFIAYFISEIRLRRAGTLLAALGGGLGFLQVSGFTGLWGGRIPLEFYSPETFGFLSLFGLPHLALARALLLLGLLLFLKSLDTLSIKTASISGLVWLLLGLVQPLTVVTAWVILGMFLGMRIAFGRKERGEIVFAIRAAVVASLISAPMVIYNFAAFTFDPFLKGWGEQNRIFSPPVGDYLLAFGLLLPFAVIGARQALLRRGAALVLAGWLLAFPFLAYAPYNLQRRLPEGIWVALVVLAIIGYQHLAGVWKKSAALVYGVSFLTTALVIVGAVFTVASPAAPLYRDRSVVEAYQIIAENAEKDDVVLASFEVSNGLPAFAPVRMVTGHGPESINADQITPRVEAFFAEGTPDAERIRLLREFDVRYYIHTSDNADSTWQPSRAAYLKLIFENERVQVYEVSPLP